MFKFEKVKKYNGIEIDAPVRKTNNSACYDMVAAEDTIVQPYLPIMSTLGGVVAKEKVTEEVRSMGQKVLETQGEASADAFINSIMTCTMDEVASYTKATGLKPTLISTGYKAYMDEGYSLDLHIRSSSPLKYWLIMANSTGIIDADYADNPDNEGEIFFQVINLLPFPIKISKGETVGQAKFVKYQVTNDDKEQEKMERVGGFGSTSIDVPTVEQLDVTHCGDERC